MDPMDLIEFEEDPFVGEAPDEVELFNLDGTPATAE